MPSETKRGPRLQPSCGAQVRQIVHKAVISAQRPDNLSYLTIMNVSFTSMDVLNTSVVDDTTQRPLFEVSTPRFKLGHRTTTIKDASGQVVAEYVPRFGHDQVTLHGNTTRMSEWLPKKSVLSW